MFSMGSGRDSANVRIAGAVSALRARIFLKGNCMSKFLMGVAAAALLSGAAAAQDWTAEPTYGSVELSVGFTPDPYTAPITSGGTIDAFEALGPQCAGWIADAPDFDVYYEAGSLDLTIAAVSGADTTLVVNAPDGSWYCDDDGGEGLNPRLDFVNPQSGLYDVWIGSYDEGEYASALLSVSEVGLVAGIEGPDWTLEPIFGEVVLDSGFTPDPFRAEVISGGEFDASGLGVAGCVGNIAIAPDFDLYYEAGDVFDLTIAASSDSDTTLVINAPDGSWYCNDDFNGLDPMVEFVNPQSGLYNIWVGSFWDGEGDAAILSISEIGQR